MNTTWLMNSTHDFTNSFKMYIQNITSRGPGLFNLQIEELKMLIGIICLNYDNVVVSKVCLFWGKMVIEKYLK